MAGVPHSRKSCINVAVLGRLKTIAEQRLSLPPLNLKGVQQELWAGRAGFGEGMTSELGPAGSGGCPVLTP